MNPYWFTVRRGLDWGRVEWDAEIERWILTLDGSAPYLLVDLGVCQRESR